MENHQSNALTVDELSKRLNAFPKDSLVASTLKDGWYKWITNDDIEHNLPTHHSPEGVLVIGIYRE